MFIVTNIETHVVCGIGENLSYWDNGYPFLENEKLAFIPSEVHIYEVETIEHGVNVSTYCYTPQDGFYPNPNYREPSAYDLAPQEVVNAIIDEYTNELIEMGVL